MFRATMCPSSGEITVSMRHLVFVTVYGGLSGMQGGIPPFVGTVISPVDGYIVAQNM
jgi:hypothetical protein